MKKPVSLVMVYIYLALGSAILGVAITFAVFYASLYFGIDIDENLWMLAIPVTASVLLNVLFIELYRKYKRQ